MSSTSNNNVFEINKYLQENRVIEVETREERKEGRTFQHLFEEVKSFLGDVYKKDNLTDEQKQKRQEIEHRAILGDRNAEKVLVQQIEDFLRERNLLGVKYPDFFDSLAHALFHEIYGFSVFYKWGKMMNSTSAKIVGKEIWFMNNGKFEKQKEELRSNEHVYEIIRALEVANKGLKINTTNPRAEVEMKNGTRVTVMIPPANLLPTIVFRRFVVNKFSFNEQAERNTISKEDINFFNVLSSLNLNTIIAGHVQSGKSTMLKTIYGARDSKEVAILIETSPESYLKRDFPERLVHDFYTNYQNVEEVFRYALRFDHDYIIFQEVRGYEAEQAIQSTERGTKGALITYHITNPQKTPEQLAKHIVDEYPNRRLQNEVRRISKQLDIGIIMETTEANAKRMKSLYEICYSDQEDKAWINYLIKYNTSTSSWEYNDEVSDQLKDQIMSADRERALLFIEHLKIMSNRNPMTTQKIEQVKF